MRTVTFSHKTSGQLAYENAVMPKAKKNDVVVRIMASSLNPHDWKYHNSLKILTKIPYLPCDFKLGHDLAGVVVEVGSHVEKYKPGDEVYSMALKPGAFSEYAAIDQEIPIVSLIELLTELTMTNGTQYRFAFDFKVVGATFTGTLPCR